MPIADKLSVILKLITYRYRYIVATDISNHALDGILPHITCFCISTQLECKNTRCVIVMQMPMENGWLQQTSNKRSIDSFKKKSEKKKLHMFSGFSHGNWASCLNTYTNPQIQESTNSLWCSKTSTSWNTFENTTDKSCPRITLNLSSSKV